MSGAEEVRLSADARELLAPTNRAHERFCHARQRALLAWRDWLSTDPPASDIEAELSGTCSAMEQLRGLHAGRSGE